MKILLIQVREDEETALEEKNEFVRFAKLNDGQLTTLNVLKSPYFEPEIADKYDVVFIGGSSDADVIDLKKYPWIADSKRLVLHCLEKEIPVLASCYGFQLLIEAKGGKIERIGEYAEMNGSGEIMLTDDGKSDLIFSDMPEVFRAVAVHKESATKLPEGVTLLARSAKCPFHAVKVNGKPFYATQFHSEIDKNDFIARIRRYQARYMDSDTLLERLVDEALDMDDANSIPWKFIDRIVMK